MVTVSRMKDHPNSSFIISFYYYYNFSLKNTTRLREWKESRGKFSSRVTLKGASGPHFTETSDPRYSYP